MSKETHHADGLIEYMDVCAYVRPDGSISIFVPRGGAQMILYDTLDHKDELKAAESDSTNWKTAYELAEANRQRAEDEAQKLREQLKQARDALKSVLPDLELDLSETGQCDHPVNICSCGLRHAVEIVAQCAGVYRDYWKIRPSQEEMEVQS